MWRGIDVAFRVAFFDGRKVWRATRHGFCDLSGICTVDVSRHFSGIVRGIWTHFESTAREGVGRREVAPWDNKPIEYEFKVDVGSES